MRRKIIRGRIKTIDSVIDKIDYKSSDGDIDVIKYCIKLENDQNEYRTTSSLGGIKEGDLIHFYYYGDDNNIKEECIILNKKTSARLLSCSRFDNFFNSLVMFVSSYGFYEIVSDSDIGIMNNQKFHGILDMMMFAGICIMFILCIYLFFASIKIISKNLTKEDRALLKEYKEGKTLNNSNIYMSDIKNIKEKENV